MTTEPDATAPPRDYRLLVPRDWFRIDLTQERWRAQLKTFVDHQADGKNVPAEIKQETWATLRNTAEAGVRAGALEFFLRPELEDGRILPASLIVSLLPRPGGLTPQDLRELLEAKQRQNPAAVEVSSVALPAGEAVRVVGPTTLDLYVQMPGGVGYLALAFAVPLSGVTGPMRRLCDSIAESLRWIL
ncbi:hypothetical protein [Streptomyces sp. Ag109_O5-10]|uniref:hypothetical protein n=1 Tax=Streptomyces sp. Ag109_O5-10 TaxID=1855349 RepID=UPI000894E434|nr:hypothetical protein [Streptomyces sp. Ag109_O5-10]SEE77352.1 hypothetical protein SAMN05216533_3632 [Streptomyces sp. Ag109_O5-10]